MAFVKQLDAFIFERYQLPTEALGIYRIVYAVSQLFIYFPVKLTWLSGLPSYLYDPPIYSLGGLFTQFPSMPFLLVLQYLIPVLLVMLLFGFKTRWTSLALGLCLLVAYSFVYSLGKIDHNIIALLIPLIMAFSGWGSKYSMDEKSTSEKSEGWPIALLVLLLSFAMFTAGFSKLIGGWLNPQTHAAQSIFYFTYFVDERRDLLAPLLIHVTNSTFWEVFDYMGVFFELAFIPAMFFPRVFRALIAFTVGFHLMNLLIMNITFTFNLIIYVMFIDWKIVLPSVQSLFKKLASSFNFTTMSVFAIGYLLYYAFSQKALFSLAFGWIPVPYSDELVLYALAFGLILWIVSKKFLAYVNPSPRILAAS